MKANEKDHEKYSDAIDHIQEGNDAMIDLFNELEDDEPIIRFGQDVIENIETAKKMYGDDVVDAKINSVVKEILEWLPLDEYEETENNEEN
jgi:hypothetical protein